MCFVADPSHPALCTATPRYRAALPGCLTAQTVDWQPAAVSEQQKSIHTALDHNAPASWLTSQALFYLLLASCSLSSGYDVEQQMKKYTHTQTNTQNNYFVGTGVFIRTKVLKIPKCSLKLLSFLKSTLVQLLFPPVSVYCKRTRSPQISS